MNKNLNEKLSLADYDNEFSFKKKISNLNISFNRIAFIFFIFFLLSLIFALKIFYYSSISNKRIVISPTIKNNFRSDIIDVDGNFLAKTVITNNAGINPILVKDKKKLFLKLKLIFPNKNFYDLEKKFLKKKFFYIEKKMSPEKLDKIRLLGEKSIRTEEKISRIYPHGKLFSHVLGQIDDNNNGISGLEKSLDAKLKENKEPIKLTLDTNIQYLIREELVKAQKIFKTLGSASILMNINSGEILSLVSLPDFDINKRQQIKDIKYINRVTKGVYELGSVFKTFTITAALNDGVIKKNTEFNDLPKKISCAGKQIGEYDKKIPSDLTAEQILIRSGNIGSVRIAQKLGPEKLKNFLTNIGIINRIEFDIEEVGEPIPIKWGKCKLATASFGHGITTTPLQLAKGYSIISNGGYNIKPTLLKKKYAYKNKERIIKKTISDQLNQTLRKIVSTKEGTANFANIKGYEVGGKTGTAQKSVDGVYTNNKINTFVAIFPTSKPKYVLLVLLDEPKPNKEYIYHYKDGSGWKYKGTPYNTAGWTSVEIAGKIIEKIGPILATKYLEF
jgi:cell division protein FtsI (penicillin-binding protein 3)